MNNIRICYGITENQKRCNNILSNDDDFYCRDHY
jgi:hypothetical protein